MSAAEEAKKYLQDTNIPTIFESLMTGLMYSRPENPVNFMLSSLMVIKTNPGMKINWETFIENPPPALANGDVLVNGHMPPPSKKRGSVSSRATAQSSRPQSVRNAVSAVSERQENEEIVQSPAVGSVVAARSIGMSRIQSAKELEAIGSRPASGGTASRAASAVVRARTVNIPLVPMILLFGGPGGAKARHASQVYERFVTDGLVYISVPQSLRNAMAKYRNRFPEWQQAKDDYDNGLLIANDLALAVLKHEMSQHPHATAFLIEGYPRNMLQIRDFEKEIPGVVDVAIILDYDEETLRDHLSAAGLPNDVAEIRLTEYRNKTLPSAKYFDDKLLLRVVAGEQEDEIILEELSAIIHSFVRKSKTAMEEDVNQTSTYQDNEELNNGDFVEVAENDQEPPEMPREVPVILVVGAPGSMKSQYCSEIVKRYDGFVHISTGDLLRRKLIENPNDQTWNTVAETMNEGNPVSSDICRAVIWEALKVTPSNWGYVIEGFPRNLTQAEDADKWLQRIDIVLLIDCTEQFCLATLKARSEAAGDEARLDDSISAARTRISQFKLNTLPMLKYYDEKGKLKVVEGDKAFEQTFQDVVSLIDSNLFIPQDTASGKSLESPKPPENGSRSATGDGVSPKQPRSRPATAAAAFSESAAEQREESAAGGKRSRVSTPQQDAVVVNGEAEE